MNSVNLNISLPSYGTFSPEELSELVRRFALRLVTPKNSAEQLAKEEERELDRRMDAYEHGEMTTIPQDKVYEHVMSRLNNESRMA